MPTATDLVTDLPADFEVFGQAVDTRLKALQPGTTLGDLAYSSATANTNTRLGIGTNGQVLGVVAGVPAWTTDASGMTNPMTTTGDTIYSSSGSTPARLGIGSTGNVLTVAGGVPTWAAPAGGAKSYTLLNSGNTTLSGATFTVSGISGIDDLEIIVFGASLTVANDQIWMRFNSDTSTNYRTAGSYIAVQSPYDPTGYQDVQDFTTHIKLGYHSFNTSNTISTSIRMSGAASTNAKVYNYLSGSSWQTSGTARQVYAGGVYTGSSAISSISLIANNGTFDAGSIYIYGAA
jgi:hypothetical protein